MATPIKVRGKRASKHSVDYLLNFVPHPKQKRSSSPASHCSNPPAKLPRNTNICGENVVRPARFAAPLEQLPTELLETIFFHQPNISLPQASPLIGKKLASKHVKIQLVLKICSAGTPQTYPSEQGTLFPATADHAEAQSAILRQKWMTLTFIRRLIPEYITKILVRELSERRLQWLGNGPIVTKASQSTIRQYLTEIPVRSRRKDQDEPPTFSHVSWRIERPPRLIRISFSMHDGIVTIEERHIHELGNSTQHVRFSSSERHQWRIFCGISGCKVPRKLLHAPWTTEKCDFLEMVVRGNATVDWVGTTSGEVAEKGLMEALRAGNSRATRLLVSKTGSIDPLRLWGFPCSSNSSNFQKLDSWPWPDKDWFQAQAFDERGVGVVPQTRHLKTAVLEAGCQKDIVKILLMAEDTNINVGDRAILAWAIEKKAQGDSRGQWLLSMLSSYHSRKYQRLELGVMVGTNAYEKTSTHDRLD